MNIEYIKKETEPFFAERVSDMYNDFSSSIDDDEDYHLSDDEVSELFNELLLSYIHSTMSKDEFNRVVESLTK
jgi:hypothetical protein